MLELTHPFDLRSIANPGLEFVGYGGMKMITNRVSYGIVPSDTMLEGSATPVTVTATQDGRGYQPSQGWHDDAESTDTVYVEVYSNEGREFHGWIDRKTRRLVQAG